MWIYGGINPYLTLLSTGTQVVSTVALHVIVETYGRLLKTEIEMEDVFMYGAALTLPLFSLPIDTAVLAISSPDWTDQFWVGSVGLEMFRAVFQTIIGYSVFQYFGLIHSSDN